MVASQAAERSVTLSKCARATVSCVTLTSAGGALLRGEQGPEHGLAPIPVPPFEQRGSSLHVSSSLPGGRAHAVSKWAFSALGPEESAAPCRGPAWPPTAVQSHRNRERRCYCVPLPRSQPSGPGSGRQRRECVATSNARVGVTHSSSPWVRSGMSAPLHPQFTVGIYSPWR